jgi:hypothetical protein
MVVRNKYIPPETIVVYAVAIIPYFGRKIKFPKIVIIAEIIINNNINPDFSFNSNGLWIRRAYCQINPPNNTGIKITSIAGSS